MPVDPSAARATRSSGFVRGYLDVLSSRIRGKRRVSLREAGKQRRREQILAAAEALIRRQGSVGFSMRDLAKQAGVAFVTPFNLFESKGGVIAALLEERLRTQRERLIPAHEGADPIDRVFDLATLASRAYAADAELHRPLLRALPGIEDFVESRVFALATALWRLALRDAEDAGMIEADRDLDLLARTLHITFRGAIGLWASGEIDTRELERQARYGAGVCILGVLTGEHRERVAERLRAIERGRPEAAHPVRRRC